MVRTLHRYMKRTGAGWFLQFPDHRVLLLIVLFALAAALIICDAVGRSQFGIELRALREDELAAETAGIDTYRHKMRAMLISAARMINPYVFIARSRPKCNTPCR